MLVPAVVQEIYPAKAVVLADILAPIVPGLKGDPSEAAVAAKGLENWLAASGVPQKLTDERYTEADLDKLVNLAFTTPSLGGLLSIAPTTADEAAVKRIYANSLYKMA